jgi:hypothetical protein
VAGVNAVGNVAAQPPAELDLILHVAAAPGRTRLDSLPPEMGRQSTAISWISPIQRRAGNPSRCCGMNGPSNAVAIVDWATPCATASHAPRGAGHRMR